MRQKIRRLFGAVPEREYDTGDIEKISHYFRRKCKGQFVIDDTTWNDLDMDRIYMLVNQTMSSPGEDVLYAMMRMPLFTEEALEKREKLIEFFQKNEHAREEMQILLSAVGKTRFGSLSDTILALETAPEVSSGIHWIMFLALIADLVIVLPMLPLHGFLLFLILSVANVTIYFGGKDRPLVEAYLDCFASLLRMLGTADKMETVNWPEIQEQMAQIREGKKSFHKLRRRAVFLTSQNDGAGDPLQILMDYVRMVFHVDILTYNGTLKEVKGKTEAIMQLLDSMGELDASIAIASFRQLLPLQCRPELTVYQGEKTELIVEDLYHPLIEEAVANSIHAAGGTLLTGSNASGKSTFLKNIAINSILAQTLHTCTCAVYQAPYLKVMTSMALRDDLTSGESYFIVEIKSLKRILDEGRKEEPLLCIVDEVLRGTNTIERIAASSRILNELNKKWILSFAATHDIELSYILDGVYENYHFEEEILDGQVVFNYLLQTGRATTRNAIKLLETLGYDMDVINSAKEAAAEFEQNGIWKTVKGERGSC